LVQGDTELDEWPLAAGEWPDLALVDYLARLQLAARRRGYSIRVRHAPAALAELLRLAGLATVVPVIGGGLVVEAGGQAEGGEEPGVEERCER
jgi:hypothetical protein